MSLYIRSFTSEVIEGSRQRKQTIRHTQIIYWRFILISQSTFNKTGKVVKDPFLHFILEPQ